MALQGKSKLVERPQELNEFYALPEDAQMLLIYFLWQGNADFSLLPFDHDVDALLPKAWVNKVGQVHNGLQRYRITEVKEDLLVRFEDDLLSKENLEKLDHYRMRKRALYPWNW